MTNNISIDAGGFTLIVLLITICAVVLMLTWDYAFGVQLIFQTPDGPMWYNPVLEQWEEIITYYNTNPFNVSNITTSSER